MLTHTLNGDLQVLVVHIGNERYALELVSVREIVRTPSITPLPQAPKGVVGMANLRGDVVTVIDMCVLLGIQQVNEGRGTHLMIVEQGGQLYGLLVDQASEVLSIDRSTIHDAPNAVQEHIHADTVNGVIIIPDSENDKANDLTTKRMLPLLNVDSLFQSFYSSDHCSQ